MVISIKRNNLENNAKQNYKSTFFKLEYEIKLLNDKVKNFSNTIILNFLHFI